MSGVAQPELDFQVFLSLKPAPVAAFSRKVRFTGVGPGLAAGTVDERNTSLTAYCPNFWSFATLRRNRRIGRRHGVREPLHDSKLEPPVTAAWRRRGRRRDGRLR